MNQLQTNSVRFRRDDWALENASDLLDLNSYAYTITHDFQVHLHSNNQFIIACGDWQPYSRTIRRMNVMVSLFRPIFYSSQTFGAQSCPTRYFNDRPLVSQCDDAKWHRGVRHCKQWYGWCCCSCRWSSIPKGQTRVWGGFLLTFLLGHNIPTSGRHNSILGITYECACSQNIFMELRCFQSRWSRVRDYGEVIIFH